MGFPVALKVLSPSITHKSDVGGVQLGLASRERVRDAFAQIRDHLAAIAAQARLPGRAFRQALGDRRFGEATAPLDEAHGGGGYRRGRSYLSYEVPVAQERVGNFPTELVQDFMKAFSDEAGLNLQVHLRPGRNPHHVIETVFKSFARAMDQASSLELRVSGVLSTKGTVAS